MNPILFYEYGRSLVQIIKGLIFLDDFTDPTKWTSDSDWSQVSDPTMVAFDRSPYIALQGGAQATGQDPYTYNTNIGYPTDESGVRESSMFIDDDGTWYMYHDGGSGSGGWRGQMAKSVDRGVTWKKYGDMGLGFNKFTSAGTTPNGVHPSTSNCLVMKESGVYYFFRFVVGAISTSGSASDGISMSPYTTEIFTSSSPLGPWTWVRSATAIGSDSTGNNTKDSYFISIVKQSSTYHGFSSDVATIGSVYDTGRYTSSSLNGPWTRINGSLLPAATKGIPENPRVFFNSFLNKWVLIVNQLDTTKSYTDKNSVFISDNLTDWTASTRLDFQHICISDGLISVGLPTNMLLSDNNININNGYVPITYDTDPTDSTKHNGRKLRYATLEPSISKFNFTGSSFPIFKNTIKTLDHSDFSAEFIVKHNSSGETGLRFRIQGSGDDYRLIVADGGKLKLQKSVTGVYSTLSLGTGTQTSKGGYFLNRIRINCFGNNIKAWLNGEIQVNYTDSSSPFYAGVSIALTSNANAEIRRLHFRTGNDVTITNLNVNDKVVLRGVGSNPLVVKIATSTSMTIGISDNLFHYPAGEIEVNGVTMVNQLIWGGDSFKIVNHTSISAPPTPPTPPAIPIDNLMSYYRLESDVVDYKSGKNGTATSLTYGAGKNGNCAIFNGTTSNIQINNDPIFQLSVGSISLWLKATSSGSSFRAIVVKGDAYGIFLNDGVLIIYNWAGSSIGIKSTGINMNTGVWNHVILTFEGGKTNGTKVYVNGILVYTTTITILGQRYPLQIGDNQPSSGQKISASMEGIGIWNIPLTQVQVTAVYDKQNSGLELV